MHGEVEGKRAARIVIARAQDALASRGVSRPHRVTERTEAPAARSPRTKTALVLVAGAVLALALVLTGCGGGGKTKAAATQRAQTGVTSGWSAQARRYYLSRCDEASHGQAKLCECIAKKTEAVAPSDEQLGALEASRARFQAVTFEARVTCTHGLGIPLPRKH